MRETFIVIPANGRHAMITELLKALGQPADHVILIDNGAEPPLKETHSYIATIIEDRPSPLNIHRWWNLGWEIAASNAIGEYAVVFVNSDVMAWRNDVEVLVNALDTYNASVAFYDHCKILPTGGHLMRTDPGPGIWSHKMTDWFFAVRGELETRFDETMAWWYGGDDFDWRARLEFDGVVMVPGAWAENRDVNGAQRDNPQLHAIIEGDRWLFTEKWGCCILESTILNEETYDRMVRKAVRL